MIKVKNKFFWAIASVATSLKILHLFSQLYHLSEESFTNVAWKLLTKIVKIWYHTVYVSVCSFLIKFDYFFSTNPSLWKTYSILWKTWERLLQLIVSLFFTWILKVWIKFGEGYIWKSLTKTDWYYKYYLPLQVFSFILICFFAMINCLFRFFYLWKKFAWYRNKDISVSKARNKLVQKFNGNLLPASIYLLKVKKETEQDVKYVQS